MNKFKLKLEESDEGSDGFLLIAWTKKEDGNFSMELHQSDPGNLLEVERCARTLARMMARSDSPLYSLIGEVSLASMDQALDKYMEAVAADGKNLA